MNGYRENPKEREVRLDKLEDYVQFKKSIRRIKASVKKKGFIIIHTKKSV